MVERKDFWKQIQDTYNTIVQHHMNAKLQEVYQASPLPQIPGWFHLGLAYIIKPDPLTVERIQRRNPYTKAETIAAQIKNLQEAGYLDTNGVATDKAQEYEDIVQFQNGLLVELGQQHKGDTTRFKSLMTRVVDKARSMSDALCVHDAALRNISDWSDFEQAFYQMQRLFAFRDDAHLIAWRYLELDGQTYEAWSLVWDGSAPSVAKMLEVRPNRGYTQEEWQAVYDALVEKGWLQAGDEAETYRVSADSKKIRDEIESKTDNYFYSAFDVLSKSEADELFNLLKSTQEQFTPEPAAQ